MANYKNIISFIKQVEGGLSKNPNDQAAKYSVPDGSGYHTNKGITWQTWTNKFGSSPASIKRFYTMADNDWNIIFKDYYWDAIKGDQIKSQKIADTLVNWAWGSGVYIPTKNLQSILNVSPTGYFGSITLKALNMANENDVYNQLKNKQYLFFNQLGNDPRFSMFKTGWINRLNALATYVEVGIKENKGKAITTLLLLGLGFYIIKKYS